MRRTLFYLPDQIGTWPVFGLGLALGAWLLFSVVSLVVSVRRQGWNPDTRGQIPVMLLVAAAIVWMLPRIVEPILPGVPVVPPSDALRGLPIRGYGIMLLTAVVVGVGWATQRARQAGLSTDVIFALAFVMVLGGLLGARLFFVAQYWSQLRGATWGETIANLVSVDKGGLVVYGSLIGAMLAFAGFTWKHKIPALPLADLIAPNLAIGLAIGRIGCLLNGCCFGGPCDLPWAVTFPAGSPPYEDQRGWGSFYGFQLRPSADGGVEIGSVEEASAAALAGLRATEQIVAIDNFQVVNVGQAREILEHGGAQTVLTLGDGRRVPIQVPNLPERSHPVHPTQIYSAVNAACLCWLSWAIYPYRRKHGQVFALLISLYAATRFLLEIIRTDEGDFLATLTISQSLSVAIACGMLGLWFYVQRQPNLPACVTSGGSDALLPRDPRNGEPLGPSRSTPRLEKNET